MDRLYNVRDTSIQDYGWWLHISLECRMYQGKGLCISGWCKLRLADSRSWECTLVGKGVVIRGIPERTCTRPVHLIRDICCSGRKDSDCTVLLRTELREGNNIISSFFRAYTYIDQIFFCTLNIVPFIASQEINAFPVVPEGQLHIGVWFITLHKLFCPQVPGQGSTHLFRMHALSVEQSALNTHSGRHPRYGSPKYSGKQVQMPLLHRAFDPQGDSLHGSGFCTGM